jgi:hypothetical protein
MLELDDDISGEKINSNNKDILNNKVNTFLNSSTFGDNTTINIGDNNTQTVTNSISIEKNNFSKVEEILKQHQVPEEDIVELKSIIDNDNVNHINQNYGDKVQGWMTKMMAKAISNSWDIQIGAAGSLLAQALNGYYGSVEYFVFLSEFKNQFSSLYVIFLA